MNELDSNYTSDIDTHVVREVIGNFPGRVKAFCRGLKGVGRHFYDTAINASGWYAKEAAKWGRTRRDAVRNAVVYALSFEGMYVLILGVGLYELGASPELATAVSALTESSLVSLRGYHAGKVFDEISAQVEQ